MTIDGVKWGTEQFSNPRRWMDAEAAGNPEKPRVALSRQDQAEEFLLMGLRLSDGISLERYEALAGTSLDGPALRHLVDIGMIERNGDNISVSNQGVMVLNAVLAELVADQ
ncbi:hypothetical protein A3764_18135 [Sulfitobacter sp. HI0129]|nr:hypothetical protein A3764_18135 [Sulfitobacter sp. HI0129]